MNAPSGDDLDASDMARLAAGHSSALNELMERHGERLFHYLIRSLQNEDDAADLAQETFVRIYQSCERFDPKQKFSTWLYAIASNLVRNRFRWRTRHPQVPLDAETDTSGNTYLDSLPAGGPLPGERLQANERAEAVRRALAALPEELRQPLILAEYEERPHAEIGTILGCSTKAVEMRLYRARQQLRSRLGSFLEHG